MKTSELTGEIFAYSSLNAVTAQIQSWALEPLTGKGLYSKHHSVAYLELTVYPSPGECMCSQVIWNIPDKPISDYHPDYQSDIEKALFFFLKHFSALTGKGEILTFEINDATFDFSSTRARPFEKAAIYALVNCFDRELHKPDEAHVRTLKENLSLLGGG